MHTNVTLAPLASGSPAVESSADGSVALLGRQPRRSLLLLGAIGVLHVMLCVCFHWDRAFLGDEWGSIQALTANYGELLSRFSGWRTMNFYLAGLKAVHDQLGAANWLLVIPGMIAGCSLVFTVAAISLRLGANMQAALVAALLTATNPLIVSYAVTIRSYILLVAFIAAMFLALLDWNARGRWRDGLRCGFWGALALLMHLNAMYSFVAMALLAAGWTWPRVAAREPQAIRRFVRLALPGTLLIGLAAAAHLPMYSDIQTFRSQWSATAPIPLTYLPRVAAMFFGSGYLVLPAIAAILYGAWKAIHDRSGSQWLVIMAVVPVTAISLSGVSHAPNAYARFLIGILPMLILLASYPIGTYRTRVGAAVAAVLLVMMTGAQLVGLQVAHRRAFSVPFHHIAAALVHSPSSRTVLLGSDAHALGFHYSGVVLHRDLVQALSSVAPAEVMCMNLIDQGGYLPGLPGVHLGHSQVIQLVGTPNQVSDRLIAHWQSGIDPAEPSNANTPYIAGQLAALLRWRGDAKTAAQYDEIGRRALPPTASRIR